MDLTTDRHGPPCVLGVPLPGAGANEHAYSLVMKALFKRALTGEGSRYTTSELVQTFTEATVPISKGNTVEEFIEDPYLKNKILSSTDKATGVTIYLAPPLVASGYARSLSRNLAFLPPFGEHNDETCCSALGYTQEYVDGLRAKGGYLKPLIYVARQKNEELPELPTEFRNVPPTVLYAQSSVKGARVGPSIVKAVGATPSARRSSLDSHGREPEGECHVVPPHL